MKLKIDKSKIICIYGPTASLKSIGAILLAKKIDGVIINADSMQVYKKVPILTSQPTIEEKNLVLHKLYSIIDIYRPSSVYKWINYTIKEINKIRKENLYPIIVGGTGLYFFSLMYGIALIPKISQTTKKKVQDLTYKINNSKLYQLLMRYDSLLANKVNTNDKIRILRGLEVIIETGKSIIEWHNHSYNFYKLDDFVNIYVCPDRHTVYNNINNRFLRMLSLGVEHEVQKLTDKYSIAQLPKILGLNTIHNYILGHINHDQMVLEVQRKTRHYAKKQYTWFNNKLHHTHVVSNINNLLL